MNPLHLVLVMLPYYFCLNLEIEDASNLHFRHIGDVAGGDGTHSNDCQYHTAFGSHEAAVHPAPNVHRVDDLSLEQANLIKALESHCRTLLGALIEREAVWFNRFNSQRNRMARSIMDTEE
jgi:hypothetical protein